MVAVFEDAPKTATTEDNVKMKKIHDLVLTNRRLKVRKIAETVGIPRNYVGHILHEILDMRKLSARWVSRFVISDNKRNRETTSEQCLTLTLFKRNPKEFLCRFVAVDENESTDIYQRPWNNRNSKLHPANVLRRQRRRSYRLERLWPPFSGIHKM